MPAAAARGTIREHPEQRGVQLVRSADEAAAVAGPDAGQPLVTIQTGPDGQTVRQVLVEEGCDIARELYLGIVVDRAAAKPVLMVSSEGGVEIEKVAAETPEMIFKEHFRSARRTAGLPGPQAVPETADHRRQPSAVPRSSCRPLCRAFVQYDCSLAEINPLVITGRGEMVALGRQDHLRRQRPVPAPGPGPTCATCPKRNRPRSGRARRA